MIEAPTRSVLLIVGDRHEYCAAYSIHRKRGQRDRCGSPSKLSTQADLWGPIRFQRVRRCFPNVPRSVCCSVGCDVGWCRVCRCRGRPRFANQCPSSRSLKASLIRPTRSLVSGITVPRFSTCQAAEASQHSLQFPSGAEALDGVSRRNPRKIRI